MNQEAIVREEELTRAFIPSQANIYDDFSVPGHLTLVAGCNGDLQHILAPYVTELRNADTTKSLSFTPIKNLHMTVQHPIREGLAGRLKDVITAVLEAEPVRLEVYGMHIRPEGIALNCYSPASELARLRSALAKVTGLAFDPRSRLANIGWITVARFVDMPSEEVIAHVVGHLKRHFGILDLADNLHVYRTAHRQMLGADKIW